MDNHGGDQHRGARKKKSRMLICTIFPFESLSRQAGAGVRVVGHDSTIPKRPQTPVYTDAFLNPVLNPVQNEAGRKDAPRW